MIPRILPLLSLSLFLAASLMGQAPGPKALAVSDVEVSPSLQMAMKEAGKELEMARVLEAMDGQLSAAVQQTRKFKVLTRSDLEAVMREQAFAASGNVDINSDAAAMFKLAGAEAILVTSVDDFQDYVEVATFTGTGRTAEKRIIRFAAVMKIIDTTTGEIIETTNFSLDNKDVVKLPSYSQADGRLSDSLLREIAQQMAQKVALRVTDVFYPARVIGMVGNQVTINRGDGTGISEGQVWEVFALGEELIDPDTGMSLGRDEVLIGEVRVNRVLPNRATAEIIENYGIQKLAVLRLKN